MEFTLLWAALTAAVGMWVGTRLWSEGLPDRPMDRLISASLVGLVLGRLVAMITQGVNPLTSPLEFLVIRGGVATPAASIGAIGWVAWTGRPQPRTLDAIAPAALLGLAGWQAGCLWRGACLGTASDLPWAWSGPGSDITRHPVEIYAALALIGAAVLIARLPWRPLLRSGAALALAGSIRLVTEPLRPSIAGGPIVWYWLAIGLGFTAAAIGNRLFQDGSEPPPT